jgi:hypothetical protein
MHAGFGRRVLETYICLAATRVTLIRPIGIFYPRAIRGFASVFELGLVVTLWVGLRRLRHSAHNQQRQGGETNSSCKLRDSHDGLHFQAVEYECMAEANRFTGFHQRANWTPQRGPQLRWVPAPANGDQE